ncbi:DPP IV N-terminal domain-containing protein [Pedobacter sp. MC2016-24]|nr:DPP IV N-terminal domain-containing protein [Pedobacter sp. MC2016-24]
MKISLLFCFILASPLLSIAQHTDLTLAEKYGPDNLQKQVGTLKIIPFFLKDNSKFWTNINQDLYLVDVKTKTKELLFDKPLIKKNLEDLTRGEVKPEQISYSTDFSNREENVRLNYKGHSYDYNYWTKKIVKAKSKLKFSSDSTKGKKSPDNNWLLYARKHQLYLKRIVDVEERKLSQDGEAGFSFSMNDTDKYADENSLTDAAWSDNSSHFYVLRRDTRKVGTMTVSNSLTQPRPYVNTYKYELPGDKDVAQYDFYVGDTSATHLLKVAVERWPDQELSIVKASGPSDKVYLLRKKRSRDEMDLCVVDLKTGKLAVLIHEVSKPFINDDLFNVSILNQGKDIIWWSDRTGWGQYYHYDKNGKLLNAITKGNWTAGRINAIDTAKAEVYLYGYGRERGINPYYAMLYKASLNGNSLRLLTPENATHAVFVSPDRKYVLDNYSRIDQGPTSVVRSSEGKFIMEVLKPSTDRLYAYGWRHPEPFVVKAKDGVTDLYGLMWKPFNFDPNKKYPVISQVYPGPQIETVWTEFTVQDRYNNTALAQLGFIVVCMGHRGNSPLRDAAYYKYGYGNLRDNAIEDDRYGLEQLGEENEFMDLSRVGIFGHSGGGMMTVAAMAKYPDFYKAGVSSSGNHDNRIYNRTWGESYQGFKKPLDLNQNLADKINGPLLLVAGESDANVNPANTLRMTDALILANKQFDLLLLPGQGHTYEGVYKKYYENRIREFFSRHLLISNTAN